jgi:hypothetical protein
MLINDDLPTLLLPINANSSKLPLGQPAIFEAANLNSADFISIIAKVHLLIHLKNLKQKKPPVKYWWFCIIYA